MIAIVIFALMLFSLPLKDFMLAYVNILLSQHYNCWCYLPDLFLNPQNPSIFLITPPCTGRYTMVGSLK
jgi:hypothetical protein